MTHFLTKKPQKQFASGKPPQRNTKFHRNFHEKTVVKSDLPQICPLIGWGGGAQRSLTDE